ncbi:DUF262 domain-containing protein [Paraburkholderia sp. EG286B]|uniref:DUF262 domain-containing protein n=1 Tax=Paraburkholderia sp. EG286B TaxID=3237011 RepID=UPI0034D2E520
MKSYVTSYNGLFTRRAVDAPEVERIEIPIIQRDYAQGRDSEAVARIRANFLNVLYDALTTGMPISLDFVYGDVENGTLRPLDGQQRLTTLFLLHWYLAWRADQLDKEQGWKQFAYATRPSARRFCACLVESKPQIEVKLREWFEDQHWFLHTWRHDPTIQAMLLMLEAIHERFADVDCTAAWGRLVDIKEPPISFHLLPIEQMGLSEDLYIKMNSRGKPLTPFENFKARFEQILERSSPDRVEEFAQKVDGVWANLLWPFRGADDIVDDEFLRYFQFLAEVCEWHDGRLPFGDTETLAERVFGPGNATAEAHLDFVIRCFDTWCNIDIAAAFSEIFSQATVSLESADTSKVVLFGIYGSTVNLFAECCQGQMRRSLPRTLLLYAVLLHRLNGTAEFPRRLRVLRNLIEASNSELRAEKMPALISDVRRIIVEGALDGITSFNQAQLADERLKAEMLSKAPALEHHLFNLEDHPLLRGCLAAFELDASLFERRAQAFHELFANSSILPALTGALLAAGDYAQRINHRFLQLGSGSNMSQWREEILAGSSRAHLVNVRDALKRLLDAVAERKGDVRSALKSFTDDWLEISGGVNGLDWRWYFVRYPEMRVGRSGIYACATGALGYNVCMLDKTAMSSYYRDPYLSAIRQQSGVEETAVEGAVAQHWAGGPWFTGYETEARWMRLTASGIEIQCVEEGLLLRTLPTAPSQADAFSRVCTDHGIGPDLLLTIPKVESSGYRLDMQDRVQLGAALLRDLVAAGL